MDHSPGQFDRLNTGCRCEVRRNGVHTLISVVGEVDSDSASDLTAVSLKALRIDHPRRLSLNMSGVTFFSAAGVHALEEVRAAAGRERCTLRIEGAQGVVGRVLSLCGVPLNESTG